MNVRITDAVALSALRPLEVVSYLRSNGWRKAGEQPGNWSRWLLADQEGEEFEVTVPLNHQFRDFAARMGDVLQVLTAVQIAEGAAKGKIEMGGKEPSPEVDPGAAIATALQAFADGLFLVILDGQELKDLDQQIALLPDSRVTFLRLTMLAGG